MNKQINQSLFLKFRNTRFKNSFSNRIINNNPQFINNNNNNNNNNRNNRYNSSSNNSRDNKGENNNNFRFQFNKGKYNNNNNNNIFNKINLKSIIVYTSLIINDQINKFSLNNYSSLTLGEYDKNGQTFQNYSLELLNPYEAIKEISSNDQEKVNLWIISKRVVQLGLIFLPCIITFPICFIPGINHLWWDLLLETIQFSGTCWIKFGQWISTRPDLFPDLLCEKFSLLHSNCPSHDFKFTQELIESNFGKSIDQLFLYFEKEPMASGSVAQVHRAVTRDGKVTVVKVLHPNVKENIKRDFFIIYSIVWAFSHIPDMKWLSLPESILEFGKSMTKQSDLELEAYHLNKFNNNFKYNPEIVFPKPIYPLVSKDVLVESFEPGAPIMEFIKKNNRHNPKLAQMGLSAYLKMMLVDNFVHADLHPGNVLVRTQAEEEEPSKFINTNSHLVQKTLKQLNKRQIEHHSDHTLLYQIDFKENIDPLPKLIFLDVGLVTQLGPQDKDHFIELFTEIVNGNGKQGAELLVRYAREAKCTEEELYEFKERMGQLFAQVQNSKLSEIHVGQFLSEILGLVREYHVKIESNFATLVMGTIVLEGLGKQLDPSLGLLKAAIPFLLKSQVYSFRDSLKNHFNSFKETIRNLFKSNQPQNQYPYQINNNNQNQNNNNNKK